MKKDTTQKIMTYVLLLGALLLFAVYFLVYKKYNDMAAEIETSNVALAERVNELKEYYDNLNTYNAEITMMQEQVNAWLDEFPADVKEEDIIVLALDTEEAAYVAYTNINIQDRQAMRTIPASMVQPAGMENLASDIIFVERKTSYVNTTDYFNIKNCVEVINNSDDRLVISNITYSENEETGLLDGTIEVTFYSVIGTGKEYVPQELPEYESGLLNLFGISNVVGEDGEAEEAVE
ncbi:MAG: hypothetical protein IJ405_01820 [Lachnospiraceae bacterium]|nr:hypothetical protein [Lachnospiraceae bacterium]